MHSSSGSGSTRTLFLDCLTGRSRQHVSSKRRNYLPVDTAGHPTRLESSSSQLCKLRISKLSELLNCIHVRHNRRSDQRRYYLSSPPPPQTLVWLLGNYQPTLSYYEERPVLYTAVSLVSNSFIIKFFFRFTRQKQNRIQNKSVPNGSLATNIASFVFRNYRLNFAVKCPTDCRRWGEGR